MSACWCVRRLRSPLPLRVALHLPPGTRLAAQEGTYCLFFLLNVNGRNMSVRHVLTNSRSVMLACEHINTELRKQKPAHEGLHIYTFYYKEMPLWAAEMSGDILRLVE
jgi:hypothetical protein